MSASRRMFILFIALLAAFGLAGCATGNDSVSSSDNKFVSAEDLVDPLGDSQYSVYKALVCRKGLESDEIVPGDVKEQDGTALGLSEKAHDESGTKIQDSLLISIKLNSTDAVPVIVIHTDDASYQSGSKKTYDDRLLSVNIKKGGSAHLTLSTGSYTKYQILGQAIRSVTLCVDRSQPK